MRTDAPSRTAEAVCFCRATDRHRPADQRILDDPYAEVFLGPSVGMLFRLHGASRRLGAGIERLTVGLITYVKARHRYLDDALLASLAADRSPPIEQVLVLGAGYDTRAWRFAEALGARPIFEVDHPATSRRKLRRLREAGMAEDRIVRVEIDFQSQRLEERLVTCGFRPGRPTFVIWEGVAMYLTPEAVGQTLDDLARLCGPGSELGMDHWFVLRGPDARVPVMRTSVSVLAAIGEPITFPVRPEEAAPLLEAHSWRVTDQATVDELARRYVPDGRHLLPGVHVLTASRA